MRRDCVRCETLKLVREKREGSKVVRVYVCERCFRTTTVIERRQ